MSIRALFILFLMAVWTSPAVAQVELTDTWVQPGEFALDFPAGWQVQPDSERGFVYVQHDGVQLTLYSPQVVAAYGLDAYNPETLLSLIVALSDVSAEEPAALDLGGPDASAVRYQNPATGNQGWLIARVFRDQSIGLIDAFAPTPWIDVNEDLIAAMAASFDLPPILAPSALVDYAAPWSQAVDELEASGFIAPGGTLVFAEPYVFASGTSLTQPLAASVSVSDLVMAGSLRYTASANASAESCGLLARQAGDN
ncbi:MAG: hypothetical protein K8J31_25835, partial [Anaerolineae bacterium]|nr:hypothetical protein [Anaerolineae bacterium]